MSPEFLFQLIWSRRWLILLVGAIAIASTYYLATTADPRYTATTTLVLDFGDASPFEQSAYPRQTNTAYLATQIDIIRSLRVADEAITGMEESDRTQLAKEYISDYNANRLREPEYRQRLLEMIVGNLETTIGRESRVLSLSFTSTDPQLAALVANRFANAYIDTSLDLAVEPARRNVEWFDEQLIVLRDRVVDKQTKLTAYQKDKNIISYDERLNSALSRYEALAADLLEAQSRTNEVRSSQLGSEHPEYRRVIQQEQAIQSGLSEQEQRVFAAKEERDELELLVQDLEIARRTYDSALQEFYQNSMESQFNHTNVAVLNEATAPSRSAWPGMSSAILAAGTLGLLLGGMLAIGLELVSRRIRTEEDVSEGTGVAVIATV